MLYVFRGSDSPLGLGWVLLTGQARPTGPGRSSWADQSPWALAGAARPVAQRTYQQIARGRPVAERVEEQGDTTATVDVGPR